MSIRNVASERSLWLCALLFTHDLDKWLFILLEDSRAFFFGCTGALVLLIRLISIDIS